MFPISDNVKPNKFAFATWTIILLNAFVFLQTISSTIPDEFIKSYALIPSLINFSNPITLLPFLTSIFLHGGIIHILSNLWFLRIFGDNVEDKLGIIKFLFLYFMSGVCGGFAQYIFSPTSPIPMIGASAAVSGVLGAYMIYFPDHKIRSVLLLFFVITFVNIPAGIYIFYWFVIQFFQGVVSIPSISNSVGGVAFLAHLGGFGTGFILAKVLVNTNSSKKFVEGEIVE